MKRLILSLEGSASFQTLRKEVARSASYDTGSLALIGE